MGSILGQRVSGNENSLVASDRRAMVESASMACARVVRGINSTANAIVRGGNLLNDFERAQGSQESDQNLIFAVAGEVSLAK